MSPKSPLSIVSFFILLSTPAVLYGQEQHHETAKFFPPCEKKSALCFREVKAEATVIPPRFYLETIRSRENRFVIESNTGTGEMFRVNERGQPVLVASLVPNSRTQLFYDPPLVMFPANLGPKTTFKSESFVRIQSIKGRPLAKIKRQVEFIGVEDLTLWTSIFKDALKVKVTTTYEPEDKTKAIARVEETAWLVQGRGIVSRSGIVRLKQPGKKTFKISHRVQDQDIEVDQSHAESFIDQFIKKGVLFKDQKDKAMAVLQRLLKSLGTRQLSDANTALWDLNQVLLIASTRRAFREDETIKPQRKPKVKKKAKARLY